MRTGLSIAIALAAGALSAPVHAQSSAGVTLDELAAAMGEHTSGVNRNNNDDGDVFFTGDMTGTDGDTYGIVAVPRDCTGAVPRCSVVTIYANFSWGDVDHATLAKLIDYNDTKVRGRAYAFGDSVGVDYQVFLGDGAGESYLSARIGEFGGVLADFVSHMKQ
ncbi:MAG: hypothetical protein H6920_10400 [Sphingomonadaceae bacterium]|nr:hypothetical protein [Sphingomonadaceae bacterium]MCP5383778.1 hypothetical protein [Altererythrobacter sp.]MCP5392015.1 hypothetical protein [Sphingomonadaceae bacterium]MCP5394334.1 hypothetical protein [Sphingomonadaceae bacterium]